MKKICCLFIAVLMMVSVLTVGASATEVNDRLEYAWFPAHTMNLSQIAYESYSHGSQNAIDFLPAGDVFAPFTARVTYTDVNWGCVVLQSVNQVYWADGSCDYMTVIFLHDEDIRDMVAAKNSGDIIEQGKVFYQAGGMGYGNPDCYPDHVHMSIYRGAVNIGTSYGDGDSYAFDAMYLNTAMTTRFDGKGKGYLEPGNSVYNGAPVDYNALWRECYGEPQYKNRCDYYPTYCEIEITDKTYAMTQPCSKGTDSSSVYVETIPTGTKLIAKGLHMNTAGNLWYEIKAPKEGITVCIPSSHTRFLTDLPEVTATDIVAPNRLDPGACFSLGGSITSLHTDLKQVSAYVYSGGNTSGTALTGKTVDVTGESYDLYNSAVDYGTKFNELPSGRYMYVVRATVDGTYYAESEKVLAKTEPEELTIYKGSFVVGDVEEEIVKETMEIAEEAVKEIEEKAPETTPQPKETASNKLAVLRKILKLFF